MSNILKYQNPAITLDLPEGSKYESELEPTDNNLDGINTTSQYDNFDIIPARIVAASSKTLDFFDDFSNRYQKYHGKDISEYVRNSVKNTDAMVDTSLRDEGKGGYYSIHNDKIVLQNTIFPEVFTHELTHKLNDNWRFLKKPKRTREEKQILKDAYALGKLGMWGPLYKIRHGSKEYFTTNTEIRRAISEKYNNALGNDLDNIILNMSDEELVSIAKKYGYSKDSDYYKSPDNIKTVKDLFSVLHPNRDWNTTPRGIKKIVKKDFKSGNFKSRIGTLNEDKLKRVRYALINIAEDGGLLFNRGGKINRFDVGGPIKKAEKYKNGGILKAQEGTGNNFWSKLWNAIKEGGMAARDAKLGAIGAQQIRDLYSEGKNQEAQDLAKQYAKANTTGIALAGGAASTGLLGDLMVTGATTAADTFIDGDVENFGKNLSLNAAFDLVGHGTGKLLKTNIGKKISNFLDKDLFNYDELWARIKHPTWQKYYHGSPKEFDIKNFYKGTIADSGLHMSDRKEVAEYFAESGPYNPDKSTVYEFYAPKPTMEFMDLHSNGINMLSGNTQRIAGNHLGKGTFDGTPYGQLEYRALRESGGEDVIDFLSTRTNDRFGNTIEPYQLKRDVTIPIEKYHWPNRPKHVDDRLKEMRKQYDIAIENSDYDTIELLNSEVSDIMAENGIPVVKYANNNAFEGGGMSYMLFDRSKLHLINPEHQFKMKHALTGLGVGLGAGYGINQLQKDEEKQKSPPIN